MKLLSIGDAKIPASLYINKDLNVVGKIIYNGEEIVIDDLKVHPYSLMDKDISDNANIKITKTNLQLESPLKWNETKNRITLEINEIPKIPLKKIPQLTVEKLPRLIPLNLLPKIPITKTDLRAGDNVDICFNKVSVPDTLIADGAIESKHFGEKVIKNIHISDLSSDKIDIEKTTLVAKRNITLVNNELFVPDTLVANDAIETRHISENAITNKHIADGSLNIIKTNLSSGRLIELSGNKLNSTLLFGKGLQLDKNTLSTKYEEGSIMNIDISANAAIDISKTTFKFNREQMTYDDSLKIKDIYVKKDEFGDVYIKGNLKVEGEKTIVYSSTMAVTDKNIELGNTSEPTDFSAVGGGITLKGNTDKTITWDADMWNFNQDVNLKKDDNALSSFYRINNNIVLGDTFLAERIKDSSLNTVGTIKTGVWEGTKIDPKYLDLNAGENVEISNNNINVYIPEWTMQKLIDLGGVENVHISSDAEISVSKLALTVEEPLQILGDNINLLEEGIQNKHISNTSLIDISKTTLKMGKNIDISGDALFVPDTLVADNAIETKHLSNDVVITEKILDGSIINSKLADNSVTNRNIEYDSIDVSKTKLKFGRLTEFSGNITLSIHT